jgi:hypothetical protein
MGKSLIISVNHQPHFPQVDHDDASYRHGPNSDRTRPPLRRSSTTAIKDGALEARRTEATAFASTSRFSSASSTRRWSEAVRNVMLQQEQHRQADDLKNMGTVV